MKLLLSIFVALATAGATASCGSSRHVDQEVPGQEAKIFLSNPITIQVVPTQGHAPSQHALDRLRLRATETSVGTASITVDPVLPDARRSWSRSELRWLQAACERPGLANLFVAYVTGGSAEHPDALSAKFSPHGIAVFLDRFGTPQREAACLVHEFGHVIGLVRDTSHMDRTRLFHDRLASCVMYFTITGSDAFCDPCKAELKGTR